MQVILEQVLGTVLCTGHPAQAISEIIFVGGNVMYHSKHRAASTHLPISRPGLTHSPSNKNVETTTGCAHSKRLHGGSHSFSSPLSGSTPTFHEMLSRMGTSG